MLHVMIISSGTAEYDRKFTLSILYHSSLPESLSGRKHLNMKYCVMGRKTSEDFSIYVGIMEQKETLTNLS